MKVRNEFRLPHYALRNKNSFILGIKEVLWREVLLGAVEEVSRRKRLKSKKLNLI